MKAVIRIKRIIAAPCAKFLLTQTYGGGWLISHKRGARRCGTRQEAYTEIQAFMRRADLKSRRRRK